MGQARTGKKQAPIPVYRSTFERVRELKEDGDTYDELILEWADMYEEHYPTD